jgi:CHAT domain-containing protein
MRARTPPPPRSCSGPPCGQPGRSARRRLVLGYAASADEDERRIFLGEAEAIASLFGVEPLLESNAAGGAIRARGRSSAVVHFSCCGYFNGADPMDSAVMLADAPSPAATSCDWSCTPTS